MPPSPEEIDRYKTWQHAVLGRDDHTCQMCFTKKGKMTVHHIKGKADYPKLKYKVKNGMTLCSECHVRFHKLKNKFEGS